MYQIIHSAKVVKCDETGDVGILVDGKVLPMGGGGSADWNASEDEAGHVKNRTHYEETIVVNEPLNITWDGNTEGLVSDSMGANYKVSDLVLTDEQIKLVTETFSSGQTATLSEIWDEDVFVADDVVAAFYTVYVRKAGAEFDGSTFPETGIYFLRFNNGKHTTSLTTTEPIEHVKTVVKKLDPKFLPDNVGGGATQFYVGVDDDRYLYHDKETTMKVSQDEYRLAMFSGVVIIKSIDETCVSYPSRTEFGNSYATVSLWNDGEWLIVHTGEYVDVPPV